MIADPPSAGAVHCTVSDDAVAVAGTSVGAAGGAGAVGPAVVQKFAAGLLSALSPAADTALT